MASLKYFGKNPNGADQPLGWGLAARADGIPLDMRGVDPNLKIEELEDSQISCDFHTKTFQTWEAGEDQEYAQVMDRIMNGGQYQLHYAERQYDAAQGGWRIRLEWLTLHRRINPQNASGGGSWATRW
mgnify:CR=1 FL=1